MGYYVQDGIRNFKPDNTESVFYFPAYGEYTFTELVDAANEHFGLELTIDDYRVGIEYIHTEAVGYDRYDSSDYTNYFVITRRIIK